jgi:hypothetical protein
MLLILIIFNYQFQQSIHLLPIDTANSNYRIRRAILLHRRNITRQCHHRKRPYRNMHQSCRPLPIRVHHHNKCAARRMHCRLRYRSTADLRCGVPTGITHFELTGLLGIVSPPRDAYYNIPRLPYRNYG